MAQGSPDSNEHKPRYGFLLLAQTLLILSSPLIQNAPAFRWVVALFFLFILMATLRAVHGNRLTAVVMSIGVVSLLAQTSVLISGPGWLAGLHYSSSAIFLFVVGTLIMRDVIIRSTEVNRNLLAGAISVYVMLGLAFGFSYAFFEFLNPGAIDGITTFKATGTLMPYIYFSFVTMTTLGYGDVSPVTPSVMTIASVQAVSGQLFVAVTIARLVGLQVAQGRAD